MATPQIRAADAASDHHHRHSIESLVVTRTEESSR